MTPEQKQNRKEGRLWKKLMSEVWKEFIGLDYPENTKWTKRFATKQRKLFTLSPRK